MSGSCPRGNCIYAIGDVHGRADLLADAFERINRHCSIKPSVAAAQILIGDLLDRGPDTRRCVETLLDDFVFVHAGLRPGKAIDEQTIDDMLRIREPVLSTDYDFGAVVVHGHTPVEQPQRRANRVNIDTGAYLTKRLVCLVITDRGLSFL